MAKIKYAPLPTQKLIFDDDDTDILMQCSGLGGGKTYNLCMKLLRLSYLNRPYDGGVLAPTYRDFRRDILPTFEDILDVNKVNYKFHKSEQWFKFPWSKGKLYVFTGEKPIAGPNLAYCGINEMSLMRFERINEMLRRVRVKKAKHPQRVMVGTPEDIHLWLEEFIENQKERGPDKFKMYTSSSSENIHIDESYSELLESMLDDAALAVFRDGQVGRIGGDYFYYSFEKKQNIKESALYDKNLSILVGLDFNVGKMAAVFTHKINDKQVVFDEMFLEGDSNTYTMCDKIKQRFPAQWRSMTIFCDAAGIQRKSSASPDALTDIAILRKEGFVVKHRRANTRLRIRQTGMNGMFYQDRIWINPRCKKLVGDLTNLKQKPDGTKNEGKDRKLSHLSDALDYVIDLNHNLNVRESVRGISYIPR